MKIWFDPTLSADGGKGGFRIHTPVFAGVVEYTFVHSVVPEKNCDIWRMSTVNALDESGDFLHPLTKAHAEWEMAIRLKDRPDFIGGFNHGDEIGQNPVFILDGEEITPDQLSAPRDFSRLEIRVEAIGFDPANPSEAVLSHRKEYLYDADGAHVSQEVIWLKDVILDGRFKSFLAMMPPLKHDPKEEARRVTDSFALGENDLQPITRLPQEQRATRCVSVSGNEYRFTMSVEHYDPLYPNSYLALLTDNGGMNYNKMYIAFAGGNEDVISSGTKWRSVTHYRIEKSSQ